MILFGNDILSWCNLVSSSVMCKYDLKDTSWNKPFIVIVSSRNQLQFSNVYCLTDFKII